MFRNKSVNVHQFSMIPRADIPRSSFDIEFAHKTTFDAGYLIPFYVDEVLPGDSFKFSSTMFARMATPLFPTMDNLHLDSFFFFVPLRILWTNFVKMMGQQVNPADSISYIAPVTTCPAGGYAPLSIFDYMGLPTVGQVGGAATVSHNVFHLRAYNMIWNEWFRDENLQNSVTQNMGDGPDAYTDYALLRRGKRRDYFTSCLPWPQKGTAVSMPLGTSAPVYGDGKALATWDGTLLGGTSFAASSAIQTRVGQEGVAVGTAASGATGGADKVGGVATKAALGTTSSGLYADLSAATSATINAIRLAFQTQKFLERDARGGTRYTEKITAHFGVTSPDARLQRPEYLGGGSTVININPIAQTGQTGLTGGATPLGTLGGMATAVGRGHGFTQSFVEHGVIIGLVSVRADLTYQQGLRRMWSRSTEFDWYWPEFNAIGEQAVLNKEIYCDGSANDGLTFGYQERYGEYRYHPSMITGLFRSTTAGTIDPWHLAQKFTALPTLNATFIQDTPPLSRALAVGASANGQQFIFDSLNVNRVVRPMPMYGVPGLIDHF